jgi:hypothetical protein
MIRRAAWLASALALCAGLAVHAATSQRMVEQLQFERDGTPNEAMQERVRAAGLPPLIFGRNINLPRAPTVHRPGMPHPAIAATTHG